MNFTTPSRDIASREPKRMFLGKSRKPGRPPRSDSDRIRTIFWFKTLEFSLGVFGPKAIGRYIQAASDALAPRGWSGDLTDPSRWSRYAKGCQKPEDGVVEFIDGIIPDSAYAFHYGPCDLWQILWRDREFEVYFEDVEKLCNVYPHEIDFQWLTRAIAIWRKKDQSEGLYEAIIFGLNAPKIKPFLVKFGIFEIICTNITSLERNYLLHDIRKSEEIFMLGKYFINSNNPIESYLSDPVAFTMKLVDTTAPQ